MQRESEKVNRPKGTGSRREDWDRDSPVCQLIVARSPRVLRARCRARAKDRVFGLLRKEASIGCLQPVL